jgi:radical SAM superfamily enzyme YgiQ (UPF0313 family)
MKKLVLIIPPSPWMISDRDQICFGPLYLSSYLKERNFEVQVVDLASVPEEHWYLPVGDVYGVTGVTPQFLYMKKIIEHLKAREPSKAVIVGGVHASVLPEHVLERTRADMCIVGEGEFPMLKILSDFPIENIPGVYTRAFENPPAYRDLLDDFPFPDRHAVDWFSYMAPGVHKFVGPSQREGKIICSRGCPMNCAFCASRKLWGKQVRFRSPENIVREVKWMMCYGIDMINFVDDNFLHDPGMALAICEQLKYLKVRWYCLSRVDHIRSSGVLKEMYEAGCRSITFGFESGSDRMLKILNKGTTVEKAYDAISLVKQSGMKVRGQLMVGLPWETFEDIEMTEEFIQRAKEVDAWGVHVLQPYPGTPMWDNPEKYGLEIDKDTDFEGWHTCGKIGVTLSEKPFIQKRVDYLRRAAGEKSLS